MSKFILGIALLAPFGLIAVATSNHPTRSRSLSVVEMAGLCGGGMGECCDTDPNCILFYYENSCGDPARGGVDGCTAQSMKYDTNDHKCKVLNPPPPGASCNNWGSSKIICVANVECVWRVLYKRCDTGNLMSQATTVEFCFDSGCG